MSSGFDVGGEDVSGTNGAVELLLETLGRHATERYGPADRLAVFLRGECAGWFTGKCVFLDPVLTSPDDRRKFLDVLRTATADLLAGDEYSESGRTWLRYSEGFLRERVGRLDPPTASTVPPP